MHLFFFRRLVIIVCAVHMSGMASSGQSFNSLLKLYQSQQYTELKSSIEKLDPMQIKNDPSLRFFDAVLKPSAEEAKAVYEVLFESQTGTIKRLAAEKLMEYYFARGYYITASEYQKYLLQSEPLPSVDKEKDIQENPVVSGDIPAGEKYFIQVGAFGNNENARQLREMLKTQNISCSIVPRTIGESRLFLVWIEGKRTIEETIEYANSIKEKYDLNFRIIKE